MVHTTRFSYSGEVATSFNEARVRPLSEPRQTVLSAQLDIDPATWRHDYVDYWGTATTAFEVGRPHDALVLTARARVEVHALPVRDPAGWPALAAAGDAHGELLTLSATTRPPQELAAWAEQAAVRATPDEAARAICGAVHEAVAYVPGVTAVHSTAADAWTARQGVCQDMAHLAVGALRHAGIPARYVSGYLHPARDAPIGQAVTGESHAWVEWWVGHWVGHDPTNGVDAGPDHVALGRGREYQDVAPVRGIYAGEGTQAMAVDVSICREA